MSSAVPDPESDDAQQDRVAPSRQVLINIIKEKCHVSSYFHYHTRRRPNRR